jgi:hypothetical protein
VPVTLPGHNTSSATTLYGICAAGKTATIGVFVATGA